MIFFPMRLRHKILNVILIILATVLLLSTLVVSYVLYQQNIKATNENQQVAVNIIKSKIDELQTELYKKSNQAAVVFKIGENVKFIIDFKEKYDLGMTETSFLDLANAVFSTSFANDIHSMAIYDIKGEMIAFSQKTEGGNRLVGYYYINPKKAFNFTEVKDNSDLKKSKFETADTIPGLELNINHPAVFSSETSKEIVSINGKLAILMTIPVIQDDYNKETDKMEPTLYGGVVLTKFLDESFLKQLTELTGMDINIFAESNLSVGTLSNYNTIETDAFSQNVGSSWMLSGQTAFLNIKKINDRRYMQAILPVFSNGKYSGAFSVLKSNQTAIKNTIQIILTLLIVYLGCLLLAIPLALFFSGKMVKSIQQVSSSLKEVAQGDGNLTKRIDIKSKDEVGELSSWFNTFIENLEKMIAEILENHQLLSQSTQVILSHSNLICANSKDMQEITQAVTDSTSEMSSDVSSSTQAVGNASDNLDIVAASTEEMTATIDNISRNASRTRQMSQETGLWIQRTFDKLDQLGAVAHEINTFTESINEISEQTNLLALNATIEAARAGNAGKGFAVVAGEIKELARQTAMATSDIKHKIDNIKNASEETVAEMKKISDSFTQMDQIVNEIAVAIEQQSLATREIADKTSTAAQGMGEINENILKFDQNASEIAADMEKVNNASIEMNKNGENIKKDALDMDIYNQKLHSLISRFIIKNDMQQ